VRSTWLKFSLPLEFFLSLVLWNGFFDYGDDDDDDAISWRSLLAYCGGLHWHVKGFSWIGMVLYFVIIIGNSS
jgi:hypothetical protein